MAELIYGELSDVCIICKLLYGDLCVCMWSFVWVLMGYDWILDFATGLNHFQLWNEQCLDMYVCFM